MNLLTTLNNWTPIPAGTIYRGDGKYDIEVESLPTFVKEKRKEVDSTGTPTFTAAGEIAKTRLELRKLALAEYKAQKLKAIKLKQQEVIAARYLDLTTRIADAQVRKDDNDAQVTSLRTLIYTTEIDLAQSNANLTARTTALAAAQASLAAAVGQVQIDARTATLVTRQQQYDTALAARDTAQTKLTTRQGLLAASEATLISRTDVLNNLQTVFSTFKAKWGLS